MNEFLLKDPDYRKFGFDYAVLKKIQIQDDGQLDQLLLNQRLYRRYLLSKEKKTGLFSKALIWVIVLAILLFNIVYFRVCSTTGLLPSDTVVRSWYQFWGVELVLLVIIRLMDKLDALRILKRKTLPAKMEANEPGAEG